jgi:hypothetical protein
MDTRLINQVVVWERILEMENEKQKNIHPKAQAYSSIASDPRIKEKKSIVSQILKFGHKSNFASHSLEPA